VPGGGRALRNAPADQRAALTQVANERIAEIRGVSSVPNNNNNEPPPPPPSGNEPPSPPPSGNKPPPPPPNNEARERFVATVKRLMGRRVNVEFDAALPDGIARSM
jgi:hypothetical protein